MRLFISCSILFASTLAGVPAGERPKADEIFNDKLISKTKIHKELDEVNIENLHERLEQLGNFEVKELSEEESGLIAEKLEQLKHVKIDTRDNSDNIFEVNSKSGASEYLYEGDIMLSESQLESLESMHNLDQSTVSSRFKRQAAKDLKKWTNHTVNYYIDGSINQRKRNSIAAALQYLEQRTCIRFREDATAENRIKVFSGKGCSARVGMDGGEQPLSLGDDCNSVGTVIHEFMHALGIWHMQSRPDRDRFLDLFLDRVPKEQRFNFAKLMPNQSQIAGPYEFGSIMHSSADAFVNKYIGDVAISPSSAYWEFLWTMGNKMPTFYDIQLINAYHDCTLKCKAATSAKCMNGGQPHPNNCSICLCPLGYDGDLCDKRPVGIPTACGTDLTPTDTWQSHTFSLGNTTNWFKDDYDICTTWITAPPGKFVLINLKGMKNNHCVYGCIWNGIEFKLEDKMETNPRYCCEDFAEDDITYRAKINPLPVIVYNRVSLVSFTFEYKYTNYTWGTVH